MDQRMHGSIIIQGVQNHFISHSSIWFFQCFACRDSDVRISLLFNNLLWRQNTIFFSFLICSSLRLLITFSHAMKLSRKRSLQAWTATDGRNNRKETRKTALVRVEFQYFPNLSASQCGVSVRVESWLHFNYSTKERKLYVTVDMNTL